MSCCGNKKGETFTKYSLVDAGISVIKHFTDPTYDAFVDENIKKQRIKACESCEYVSEKFGTLQCKICSCFITAKASLKDQTCPHPKGEKW